jgi:tryptophan-rich sensory protein
MAYSQWLVYTQIKGRKDEKDNWKLYLIPVLFIYCVLYPFYTMGFRNKKIVDFANVLTIILSGFIAWSIYDITQIGSYMILLTTLWSTYATLATFYHK